MEISNPDNFTHFFFYNIFGLNIKSQLCFPELNPSKNYSDLTIQWEEENKFPKKMNENSNIIKCSKKDITYTFDNKPLFRVRNGNEITINKDLKIDDKLLRTMILNQGMGIVLYQKGYLVLHGSAVNISGNATAFLGYCGEGKSTVAAALNLKGHPLITDDVLVVDFNENGIPLLLPGSPGIKLWDDVIDLILQNESFTQIYTDYSKYVYETKSFCNTSIPLKNMYIMETSSKNSIDALKPQDALIELIKNDYMIFSLDSEDKHRNLIQCAKIASNVPVKRLRRDQSLDTLEELINFLEEDIYNLKSFEAIN